MKFSCRSCDKMAVWFYMPSCDWQETDRYLCNEHIKKGCSCNVDPLTGIEDTDSNGNLLPCCEYLYDENGFDEE